MFKKSLLCLAMLGSAAPGMTQSFSEQALPHGTYGLSLNNNGLVGGYRFVLNERGRPLLNVGGNARTSIICSSLNRFFCMTPSPF